MLQRGVVDGNRLAFAERLQEMGQPEALPKLEGKRMFIMLAPKSQKKKKEKDQQ